MIDIKTPEEIKKMQDGGKILSDVLFEVLGRIKEGVTEKEIDQWADELIVEKGGFPAFKKVPGYKNATCLSTNNVVVHGIPGDRVLRNGDIIGVDCGVFYKGFFTDMSHSIIVGGKKDPENEKFLKTGEDAIKKAIAKAVIGNRVGDISLAIQETIEGEGYSVVKSLIGHGVGKKLHEDPEIPGYLNKDINKTPKLRVGMTIAIEAIYNMGDDEVSYGSGDGWTIVTTDGSLSGLFERSVAITKDGPLILTA